MQRNENTITEADEKNQIQRCIYNIGLNYLIEYTTSPFFFSCCADFLLAKQYHKLSQCTKDHILSQKWLQIKH